MPSEKLSGLIPSATAPSEVQVNRAVSSASSLIVSLQDKAGFSIDCASAAKAPQGYLRSDQNSIDLEILRSGL
jgi:hypothetical protein